MHVYKTDLLSSLGYFYGGKPVLCYNERVHSEVARVVQVIQEVNCVYIVGNVLSCLYLVTVWLLCMWMPRFIACCH